MRESQEMNAHIPTTRAEAADAARTLHTSEQVVAEYVGTTGPVAVAELVAVADDVAPEFLPLGVRRVLYILGLVALVAAPVIGVEFPDYETAITTGGNLLGAAAIGTALANPTARRSHL